MSDIVALEPVEISEDLSDDYDYAGVPSEDEFSTEDEDEDLESAMRLISSRQRKRIKNDTPSPTTSLSPKTKVKVCCLHTQSRGSCVYPDACAQYIQS